MDSQKPSFLQRAWRVVRVPVIVIVILYIGLVIYRIPAVLEKMKTEEAVQKIHAQKLTLKDVMGENLPPEPDPAQKDVTVQGIDVNVNGIRDDVELAIFKEYPDSVPPERSGSSTPRGDSGSSTRIRAVLLQYAMALQMEVTQPIVNAGVVGAVASKQDSAFFCITNIVPENIPKSIAMVTIDKYDKFVSDKQFSTEERKTAHKNFYEKLESGSTGESYCDIELSSLPN